MLGASQNESAYGSVPDPFPSPLKMGKGRQRQTSRKSRRASKTKIFEFRMEVSLESSTTPGDELRCTIPEETTGFCNRLIPRLPPYDIAVSLKSLSCETKTIL